MRVIGAYGVGGVTIDFEVANYDDVARAHAGDIKPERVRRRIVRGIVDPGAAMLVLPESVVKELGLPLGGKAKVRYADGRRAVRREAKAAQVTILGRDDTFTAVVEPKRKDALIGAIVLEALDLLVDCKEQRVVPRDPSGPIYEIE